MDASDLQQRDARRFVENLDDLVARSRPGDPLPGLDAIDGTDRSGTVYCVVDLGGKLSRVDIAAGWWQEVGPHGVAAAVLQSLRFARDKAALARMVLDHHGRAYPASTRDDHPRFGSEPACELPPYDSPEFVDALWHKANRAAAILADVERFARERDGRQRREVIGPRGLFRVVVCGVTVVAASVDETGLRPADAGDLAMDARDALLAARPSSLRRREN